MKRYLFVSVALVVMALMISTANMAYLLPVALALVLLADRRAARILIRWKFLLFLSILIFGVPLFIGSRSAHLAGIPYSPDIFQMSLAMGLRSVLILMSVKILTGHISVEQMARGLQRMRLRRFSQVFAVSMGVMPHIREITLDTFREYRRSSRRLNLFSDTLTWSARLIARLLHFADQYVPEQEAAADLHPLARPKRDLP